MMTEFPFSFSWSQRIGRKTFAQYKHASPLYWCNLVKWTHIHWRFTTSKRKTSKKYPLRGRYYTNLPARRESSIKSDLWMHSTRNVLKSWLMLIRRDSRYLLRRAGLVCVHAANELLMKIKAMIYCRERLSWMLWVRNSKEDYRWWRLDASATHKHYNRETMNGKCVSLVLLIKELCGWLKS